MPFKAKNNREAVVVCAIHVVKRPSKRSVLVIIMAVATMPVLSSLPASWFWPAAAAPAVLSWQLLQLLPSFLSLHI